MVIGDRAGDGDEESRKYRNQFQRPCDCQPFASRGLGFRLGFRLGFGLGFRLGFRLGFGLGCRV